MTADLLKSAEEQFAPLSEAERRMLTAVGGKCAVCSNNSNDSEPLNDPRNGAKWDSSRTIRSDVIEWLCKQGGSFGRDSSSGIWVYGAKIAGVLNLSYAVIPYPLILERCAFMDEISLKNAKVPSLILTGSCARTILADGIDVANNVLLNKEFYSKGQVLFRDANIGGGIRAEDATFEYQSGGIFGGDSENSLGCDRVTVNGSIFLSKPGHGSTFKGEVGLAGAFVGSNLECDGSTFENPGRIAIRADRIKVIGGVFLRNGFSSKGAVRFLNAQMDVLDCSRSAFEGDCQAAFTAEAAAISGYAVFEETTARRGAIQLRAVSAGDVSFRGVELVSVDLRYATVRRALRLKRVRFIDPQRSDLNLRNASTDSIDDDKGSWPGAGKLFLDSFSYNRFGSVTPEAQEDSVTCPIDCKSRLDWLRLDSTNPPQAYKQLAQFYSTSGETSNSREVLYRLEDLLRRRQLESDKSPLLRGARWVLNQCLKTMIGYGYKLWRTLYWIIPLCALGWVISYSGYYAKVVVPTDKDAYLFSAQHGYVPNNYPRFSATIFTIEHSLPVVSLDMSSHWSADGSPQYPEHPCFATCVRIWLVAQRLFGWLLSLFFVAGITGLAKSDK